MEWNGTNGKGKKNEEDLLRYAFARPLNSTALHPF